MATYRVMSWRDIPTQVKATDDSGATVSKTMPVFFQQEIDRIAMAEGLIDSPVLSAPASMGPGQVILPLRQTTDYRTI